MIDPADFPEIQEAIGFADKASERAARGLPTDRYATSDQLRAIFLTAIPALYAFPFMAAQEAYRKGFEDARKQAGLEAMKMEGE